jgi:ATP-binding cassette subfamily B multidrug efflux pump
MELWQMSDKIKWFWNYYRKYPYVLAILLFLTPVQALFQVTVPRLIEFTVDYIKSGSASSSLAASILSIFGWYWGLSAPATFALTLVLVGFAASLLYAFVQSHRAWMNLKLEWLFRQDAFDDITSKGPDFFNRFRTGDLVTRMTDDVAEKLSWFACSGIFRLYEALLMVTLAFLMMLSIDPRLTLYSVGPLPVLIVIFFISATVLDKRYELLQKKISRLNDVMEACFYGIRVVKAYVKEKAQQSRFYVATDERRKAEISAIKATTVVDSLYMYIWQFGVIIVLSAGGYMVINAGLSLGKLVAFIYYIVYMIFPMFDIGQFLVKSRQSFVSIGRLAELRNVSPMVTDSGIRKIDGRIKGHLIFESVGFSFPDSERKIIDDVSCEIDPGQTVALVGRVGSGKSWLVNMIPRLIDPTEGCIKLDGHKLPVYSLEELRKNIGYVPQEPVMFSDTIRNNILFGRRDISESDLAWAVDIAQLKEEIASFPKGLETMVGTRGMTLSGGQKQRVALARALVGKPKILILDDCTSALDAKTESALWERLHEVTPDTTAVLITHRPETLEKADKIFTMDEGRIIETGRHHDLLNRGGQYARIYKRYLLEEQVATA